MPLLQYLEPWKDRLKSTFEVQSNPKHPATTVTPTALASLTTNKEPFNEVPQLFKMDLRRYNGDTNCVDPHGDQKQLEEGKVYECIKQYDTDSSCFVTMRAVPTGEVLGDFPCWWFDRIGFSDGYSFDKPQIGKPLQLLELSGNVFYLSNTYITPICIEEVYPSKYNIFATSERYTGLYRIEVPKRSEYVPFPF